jgi:hypothetical protein
LTGSLSCDAGQCRWSMTASILLVGLLFLVVVLVLAQQG